MLTLLTEFINLYKKRLILAILLIIILVAVAVFFIFAAFNQFVDGLNKIKKIKPSLNTESSIDHKVNFTDWAEISYEMNAEENNISDIEDKARLMAIQKTQQKARKIAGWLGLKLGKIIDYSEIIEATETSNKIKVIVTLSYEILK